MNHLVASRRGIVVEVSLLMLALALALVLTLANPFAHNAAPAADAATASTAHAGAIDTEDGLPAAATDTLARVKAEMACEEAHGVSFTEQPVEVAPGFVTIPIGHYDMLRGETAAAAAARGNAINQQCYLSTHSS